MNDKSGKQDVTKEPAKAPDVTKKDQPLTEKELDKASGGQAHVVVAFVQGSPFGQAQSFQMAGKSTEPSDSTRSIADIYKDVAAKDVAAE